MDTGKQAGSKRRVPEELSKFPVRSRQDPTANPSRPVYAQRPSGLRDTMACARPSDSLAPKTDLHAAIKPPARFDLNRL